MVEAKQSTASADAGAGGTRPLADQLIDAARRWAHAQFQLVTIAAEFADSAEWLGQAPTAAHWLASVADIEPCTAREWIRIGTKLQRLPATADAFSRGAVSYSKVRTLTRIATPRNESELLDIATTVPAADLGRAIATWLRDDTDPNALDNHHRALRSIRWRTDGDGMTTFTLRLPPLLASMLITALSLLVMRNRPTREPDGSRPNVAQQRADALQTLLDNGTGTTDTEIILHVRGDGATYDNGTPVTDTLIERIAPTSFLRAMIHDANSQPVDVSNRRRHPTTRQKRLVKERDQTCRDCGRADLLHYDHNPPHHHTGHTLTTELELRCAPCHQHRHQHQNPETAQR